MPNLKSGADCCGCTACASICGHDALHMIPDSLGFKYPVVDYDKCVECKLCEKMCEYSPEYRTPDNYKEPIPYGLRLKDKESMMKSRSGGAFAAISDWILDKDGVVYGSAFKDHFVVAHKRATNANERDAMRGSKYVQSDLEGIFKEVRKDLSEGKWVLFSGTTCQVNGLKTFIPKKLREKLLLVDIVCHGVPSPAVWQSYLQWVEETSGKKIKSFNFRDKSKSGWTDHKESILFEGAEFPVVTDEYTYLFYQHIMIRDCCGSCPFTNLRRPSDLTLADFWGWEKTDKSFNADDKGASLLLVSTPKGKKIFDEIREEFDVIEPELRNVMQPHLKKPTKLHRQSKKFKNDFANHDFNYLLHHYGNRGWRFKLRDIIRRIRYKYIWIKQKHFNKRAK